MVIIFNYRLNIYRVRKAINILLFSMRRIRFQLYGYKIGRRVRLGRGVVIIGGANVQLLDGAELGNNVRVQASKDITIGKGSFIGPNSNLYGTMTIGDNIMTGPNVSIIAGNHAIELSDKPMSQQPTNSKGIVIGNNVWVGANSVILDGVTIADGAVIGAGSVVTKNAEANGIYIGNPAKLFRMRS